MRVNKCFIVLTVLIFTLFFALPYMRLPLPFLKNIIMEEASIYGIEAEVQRASANLRGRVLYEGISFSSQQIDMGGYVDRVEVESSLFDLLRLYWAINRKNDAIPHRFSNLSRVRIRGERLSWSDFEGGLIQSFSIDGRGGSGKLNITGGVEKAEVSSLRAESIAIRGSLSKEEITLHEIRAQAYEGVVNLWGGFNFKDGRVFGGLRADSISIGSFLKTGKINGAVDLSFALDTTAISYLVSLDRVSGEGSLQVRDFSEDRSPYFITAYERLRMVGVDSLYFDSIGADFEVSNGRLRTESFLAKNEDYSISARGRYRLKNHHFSFSIDGTLQPHLKDRIRPVVWGALLVDEETDERIFRGEVRGVPDRYTISVDSAIMKRGVNSFFRNIFR